MPTDLSDSPQPISQNPYSTNPVPPQPESVVMGLPKKRPQVLFFVFAVMLILTLALLYFLFIAQKGTTNVPPEPAMKVGAETIYKTDVAYELALYPENTQEAKDMILAKIANDSITLQAGSKEGLIALDSSFYDSPTKDYDKRIAMVESVRNTLETKGDSIEGAIVSIWFRNNGYIGPLGLEKSKAEALKKITDLQKQVTAKKITVVEAGEAIKNDSSLEKLDLSYTNNAIYDFTSFKGDGGKISLNSNLDAELWNLAIGEPSKIYLTQSKDIATDKLEDALYSFGVVTKKNSGGTQHISYEDWLATKKGDYEITNY